jgi:chaperonin cofactor prefoldin
MKMNRSHFKLFLKFLVLLVYGYIIFTILNWPRDTDFPETLAWLLFGIAFLLIPFLESDRLEEIVFSKKQITAKLKEYDDVFQEAYSISGSPEIAAKVSKNVLLTQGQVGVQEEIEKQIELNVDKNIALITQAIRDRRKIFLKYRVGDNLENYQVYPVDVKTGETKKTYTRDYFWCFSEKDGHPKSFHLENIISVGISQETFDPKDITGFNFDEWDWGIPRDWDLG